MEKLMHNIMRDRRRSSEQLGICRRHRSRKDTGKNNTCNDCSQDAMLTQVAMANSYLQLIRDYNKQIRDEVVLHMASMDNKLTSLRKL